MRVIFAGTPEFAARALEFEQALRSESMERLVARLDRLEGDLARLMVAARELRLPDEPGALENDHDTLAFETKLGNLLGLLQNNNLRALAEFEALRHHLSSVATPDTMTALTDAIATLGFANAARQLKDIMDRRVTQ